MDQLLICISLIIGLSALLTIFFKLIKQPPIIAYLITGILAGPLFFNIIQSSSSSIQELSHLGVALLLFIVGLNLDLRVLKEVGKVSFFAGILEIFFTAVIGFVIAFAIGFRNITALYIAVALAFSSTVVVVKILSDKKEIDTLHGRIALGILIVEDFVAALALMVIPIIYGDNLSLIFKDISLIVLLIVGIFLCSFFVLNKLLNYLARNQEALFLFGIAWALIISSLFFKLGFSVEMGALIAGISLASSKYTLELGGKIKPLRDFFVVIFFAYFGSQLIGPITFSLIRNAIYFTFFIFIGKPIIVMTMLKIFGYKKRTNFLTGTSLAQISEFSLIIVLMGFNLGHISSQVMSMVILIAIFTIALSSYSIHYSHNIFNKLSDKLSFFENENETPIKNKKSYKILLFGYHRIGYKILEALHQMKIPFAVVDYNPKVILSLSEKKIDCIFGDAADENFLSELDLDKVDLIISTIPDENSNLTIAEKLKELDSKAVFISTAEQPRHALDLYRKGIDYVLIPHHLGGDYAANMIKDFFLDKKKYQEKGKLHYKELSKAKMNSSF